MRDLLFQGITLSSHPELFRSLLLSRCLEESYKEGVFPDFDDLAMLGVTEETFHEYLISYAMVRQMGGSVS